MEYYELSLKLKFPRLSRKWFRYRVRTLLLLMLLVAIGTTLWHVYGTKNYRNQLLRQLDESKAARDVALQNWKSAVAGWRQGGRDASVGEAAARSQYFKHRAAIDDLLRRIHEKPGNTPDT